MTTAIMQAAGMLPLAVSTCCTLTGSASCRSRAAMWIMLVGMLDVMIPGGLLVPGGVPSILWIAVFVASAMLIVIPHPAFRTARSAGAGVSVPVGGQPVAARTAPRARATVMDVHRALQCLAMAALIAGATTGHAHAPASAHEHANGVLGAVVVIGCLAFVGYSALAAAGVAGHRPARWERIEFVAGGLAVAAMAAHAMVG
ncbi:hypothetical protein ACO2Q7_07725 [Rathayibacter sp. KR2-224]|uniref:hypothetical protein n=1 Tax=Rathayibacter sp. KR2-224 TaxID=3400913 RepID=UPI003C076029